MRGGRAIATAAAILAAGAASARAGGPAVQAPGAPDDLVGRDVVLRAHGGEIVATLEVELSKHYEGKPISMAPDLYVGVTERLTAGVIHSARGYGVLDAGDGLCFRGVGHGCPEAYDNLGVDVRYRLRAGGLAIAARTRVVVSSFSPWKPSLRPGALIRLHRGRFAVIADPHLQLGLDHRDEGNRDWLRVPLWFAVQPARRVAVALRSGLDGELATFGDTFAIPLGLDVTVRVTDRTDLAAAVAFPSLGGPQNRLTSRVGWVTVSSRW